MKIPSILTQADSWEWHDDAITINGKQYKSQSYALAYVLRGPAALDLGAVADGDGWTTTATATQTAALPADTYAYQAVLSAGDSRLTIERGTLKVLPNLAAITEDYDPRSPARIALEQAEAALAGYTASGGAVKKWRINNREQEFTDPGQLIGIISYWKRKVLNEAVGIARNKGEGNPTTQLSRFI